MMTDKGRFLKKIMAAQIRAKVRPETRFFCHFLKFGSLVFLEITYSDRLQQCLTSSRGKFHKKKFLGPNLGQFVSSKPKSCPKLGFFHFLKFGSLAFL